MQEDEDFIWCTAGCGNGQIHDGGAAQPIVKCASCAAKTCFVCKTSWHAGMTCREWSLSLPPTADDVPVETKPQQAQELRTSENIIKRTTKPSLRCKSNIEKNGGCSLMTCTCCSYQFNWFDFET
ncbi:hypothetical protein B0I37DRAFT_88781 [Chaetomium sp. MPI-CAGE-AT-0009]|nr:hypothetical protein B0I37DRAFT_88781 [Chaetomium sp. MPI-CAGE-AT-0009]